MGYDVVKLLNQGKQFYRMSTNQDYYNYNYERRNTSGFDGASGAIKLPAFILNEVSQDQFMRELMPESHLVNDLNYRQNTPVTSDGLPFSSTSENSIVDWKQRARVAIPKQNTIAEKQRVHFIGNDLDLDLIEGDYELFDNFKKQWKRSHIHHGISLVVKSALTTGDGAIYFYIKNNKIKYKTFSYKYGDVLNHHRATNSRPECITRYYSETNDDNVSVEVMEVYDDTYVWTYKRVGTGSNFVEVNKQAHGFTRIPIAYNKLDDVAWGMGQSIIDKLESSYSDLREANEYFQFQILFLKGGKVKVLPNASKQGKVIQGDANSDAKQLDPQSKPESFEKEINILTEELHNGTGVTIIDPEILKGDTSGAYVKSIYFPATSYAKNQIPYWSDFFDDCIEIFTVAVGKLNKKIVDYMNLQISWELNPFVPQNELEEAQISQTLMFAGARSKRTASSLAKNNAPNEYELILEEEEKELEKSFGNQVNDSDVVINE